MLKVLLKKQISEAFRNLFFDAKNNRLRTKGRLILWVAFFIFLSVGVLGGMFTFLAISLCGGLASVNMGWLYFVLMGGIAIVFGSFGSVFNTYSSLYLPKDNDLLLSMPIPARVIVISRLLNVYLLGAMYSALVLLPTMIVYWVTVGATAANIICGLLFFLIISVIVLVLSCLLGWVVARISLKLKNKSFVIVLISLLFVILYYYVYFKANELIRELIANAAVYGAEIKGSAYGVYLFGRVGEGDLPATAIFTAAAVLILVLMMLVLSRGFLKLATASGSVKKVRYTEKRAKLRTAFGALLAKEFAAFTSNPMYMLNCGLGTLLLPALGIYLLASGSSVPAILNMLLPDKPGCGALLLCTALMMLSTANNSAAPSISLEGKSIWIPQSLPVDAKTVLRAKAAVQLLLTEIPMLFAVICAAIALRMPLAETLLLCLVPLVYSAFSAMFCLFLGVRYPMLQWTSVMAAVKQGAAVAIALFGGWGVTALFAVPYLLFGYQLGLSLYLAIWAVVLAAAAVLLYRWLMTKGAAAFSRL